MPLLTFKYSGFFIQNANVLLSLAGIKPLPLPHWILPLGVSFYTFRLLSYQIEIFRGKLRAERKLINLFLYSAFFPQYAAGPIVRYHEFYTKPVLGKPSVILVSTGLQRFMLGLAKKVLIANNLGTMADAVFALPNPDLAFITSWLGVISYALQVYYDFSGYSDMAIGLSRMAGFTTPENFNFPYLARSVRDFWRRWHMTLTSWFRDYLFLPTAFYFNRKLPKEKYLGLKTEFWIYFFSILLTWTLVGFWHGASWTFIIWGVTFGIFLILEHIGLGRLLRKSPRALQHLYTMTVVMLAWIFFRAGSFQQGFAFIRGIGGCNGMDVAGFEYYRYFTPSFMVVLTVAVAGAAGLLNKARMYCWKWALRGGKPYLAAYKAAYYLIINVLLLSTFVASVSEILRSGFTPFIYFKF